MKKILLLVFINICLFGLVDYLFGIFISAPPVFLNTKNQYETNYRNYFIKVEGEMGSYYTVDNSVPVDLVYENKILPADGFQVLAFGDSFTAGQGVKAQDTWIKQLEKLSSQQKIYGLNYGISGLGINEVRDVFDYVVPKKNPNLIVYALVLNDAVADQSARITLDIDKNDGIYNDLINNRTTVFDRNRNVFLNFFYKNFNIFRHLIRLFEIKEVTRRTINYYQNLYNPNVNSVGMAKTFDLIEQMNKKALAKKTNFLVMVFPLFYSTQKNYPFEEAHKYLSSELSKRDIKVLDLLPFYRGIKDSELWVHPVDQHPNDYAHSIAAKALYDYLKL